MTFDHSQIICRNLEAARRFYGAATRPLGLAIIENAEDGFTLGRSEAQREAEPRPVLRVGAGEAGRTPCRLAFEAPDDVSVRAFFRAALEAGGREETLGYPGPRPADGGGGYYAARVTDPDGNHIECRWRRPARSEATLDA
jgi:catechol 2,3-dioxygenase-like lactoylglutathione lyase family enzyme